MVQKEYVDVDDIKYRVILKSTGKRLAYSAKDNRAFFSSGFVNLFTKEELINHGLEAAFDNPMFDVVEIIT